MKFSKSELDIICQYAAPTKAETLAGMKEIVPVIKDLLTKAIVENAIRKLEKIPEPECSQFVAATKARFRFYLSDEGYRNAKRSEQEGEIKIKSHAAVAAGKLYPDKKPRQQER